MHNTPTRSALLVGSLLFLIIIFALSLQLWSSRGERILWHSPSQVEGLVSDSPTRSRSEYSAGIPESSTVPADISNDTERTWRLKRLGRRSAPSHKLTATQANSEASLKSLKLNSTSNTTIPRVSLLPPSLNLDQNPDVVPRSEESPLRLYAATADPPSGCHEAHCMEYLTESEKQTVKNCDDKVYKKYNRTPDDGTCSFIDGQERLPVALVGSQGSGNTWVRDVLERTAGICTGHSTCDYMTRVLGFIGEGVKSGNVLVVETHDSSPRWNQDYTAYRRANAVLGFGSAIYIVRNPYYSAIAEWNRLTTSNILRNESRITPTKHLATTDWDTFIHEYIYGWQYRLINWVLKEKQHPVHVLRYEDLQQDTVREVEKMLNFLNISYKDIDIELRLKDCYDRPHNLDDFARYSSEQKEFIRSTLMATISLVESSNIHVLKLHEYLTSFQ